MVSDVGSRRVVESLCGDISSFRSLNWVKIAQKSSSKETFRKKVSLVETDLSSEEEILSVELSAEDDNVST